MSIEVMKRIKSLLQDTKMIDSHTISAVVAECDMAILAKQPTTTEPVAWPLMARVWKRESTQEWVLEIAGTLGDTDMNIRHTQPLSVAYENVPGLPTIYTHPAPSVPADVVRVPVQVMKDASEALGNFVSDHGWGDADMQAMDNLDAYIARHEANRAAMLAAK